MAPAATATDRIALIGPTHPAPGGIVHFTHGLAAALAAAGHEPLVIGWRRRFPERLYPGTIRDEVSRTAVSAAGDPMLDLLDPRTWRLAARAIRRSGARCAVLQWWHPMHAPAIASLCRALRRAGLATVLICHNVEPHESNPLWRRLTRWALSRPDALVVHAAALRHEAEALVPGARVVEAFLPVFDNVAASAGVAPAAEVAAVRARAGAAGDVRLLVTFGYVRPYKGVADAIAAMGRIRTPAVLVVAGECWDDPAAYARAAADAGVADRVTLDFRYVPNDEIPALFGAADAVLMPYRTATQSAVAALAFAYDRPVVATRAGGLEELVQEGVTGALAEPGDVGGIAAAIDRVLGEPRDWTAGIAAVRERFSWARYAGLIEIAAAAGPPAGRDAATHAVLDRASRRAKAAKIVRILESERRLAGASLLDIGTGSGTIAAALAEAVGPAGRVVSVDVADVRVDRDGFDFRIVAGTALPFPDAAFDVVVSNHVIEHVGDAAAQQRHVDELVRVLRPGGVAYVAAPHRWQLVENHYRLPLLGWLPRRLADRYVAAARRAEVYDCRPVTRRGLRTLMRSAGLTWRDATGDLVTATAALDAGPVARALRRRRMRALVRGPLIPTIAAIGRKPG